MVKESSHTGLIVLALVICFLAFLTVVYYGQKKPSSLTDFLESIFGVTTIETTVPTTRQTTVQTTRYTTISTTSEDCLNSEFVVYSSTYNNETRTLYMVLDNRRATDLVLENLYIFYPDNRLETKSINKVLNGHEVQQVNISNINSGFTSMKIKTDCPDVFVDFIPTMITSKIISILGSSCDGTRITLVLSNDGTSTIMPNDLNVFINNQLVGTFGKMINIGTSEVNSFSPVKTGQSNTVLVTSPGNSVRITVWC